MNARRERQRKNELFDFPNVKKWSRNESMRRTHFESLKKSRREGSIAKILQKLEHKLFRTENWKMSGGHAFALGKWHTHAERERERETDTHI